MVKDISDSYSNSKSETSIQEIRKIILGLEIEELLKLQAWIKDNHRFSEDVATILPSAIRYSVEQDNELETVLIPIIEDAVFSSVKNNPDALAEALYPVMAPAIRRSISEAIRAMLESINQTLENTFSTDRIKIRLRSWITGKSYAELLLAKSGFFRVKHVFLMDKKTGLLIEKVSYAEESIEDADMVSAMLTAIQDFVKDAFSKDIKPGDSLDTIKIQDLNVWIQEGSAAVLVVVTEGYIPESYRPHFKEQIEKIHIQYGAELKSYSGEELQNEELKPFLKSCLIENEKLEKRKSPWKIILLIAILLMTIGVLLFVKIRDNRRFDRFVTDLDQKPGVLITDNWKDDGLYYVSGLRDVSLRYFGHIALLNEIDSNKVRYSWETFISHEPQFVLQRFEKAFGNNQKIFVHFDKEVLRIEGKVNEKCWKEVNDYFKNNLPGGKIDYSHFVIKDTVNVLELKAGIEDISINFDISQIELSEIQKQNLDNLVNYYKMIGEKDKEAKLSVLSYTLNKDSSAINRQMAIRRANKILSFLKQKNIQMQNVGFKVLNDKERMREVYFKVYLSKQGR